MTTGGYSLIHASNVQRPGRVIETRLMLDRYCLLAAVYRLPGVA